MRFFNTAGTIEWPAHERAPNRRRVVIECKLLHTSLEQSVRQGLDQTRAYMDRCGAAEGHLVVFDRTPGKPWEDKLFHRTESAAGMPITVWGM